MVELSMHEFADASTLAEKLADQVSHRLAAAIEAKGRASIAVSGGSTPKKFFQALSTRDIAWNRVTVTLVDERFVPVNDPRSNHALVRDNLLQHQARAARFIPLFHDCPDVEEAAARATQETEDVSRPFDVVILGMGGDGHTASFFPGGNHLAEALDPSAPRCVISMEAPGADELRLTFSFSSLSDANLLVLHIEGEAKKDVLKKAQSGTDENEMPIRAVLNRAASPVGIYWAP
ncbi:6-phosphogluconolactonase [Rhizobium halophilum]|uniref:6-phosphogluconolactonase n=1 Tax=Rhizobium halophilum TaxID=2846852 RepID=UPI001EFCE9B9|nr:6-phosphogluconolactonase [Rhizobium halophilum]MCF6369580.1 6-phosphogluconolactonase [Rhizobium halophilum]